LGRRDRALAGRQPNARQNAIEFLDNELIASQRLPSNG
jgi:hypothetical protein